MIIREHKYEARGEKQSAALLAGDLEGLWLSGECEDRFVRASDSHRPERIQGHQGSQITKAICHGW